MSVHATLTAAAAWPADLVAGLSLLSATDQVYTGRRPRSPSHTEGEVWIERLPAEERGMGTERLTAYPYLVHVFSAVSNAGPDRAGDAQLDEVEQAAAEIVDRYAASRRLHGTLSGLLMVDAVEDSVDLDPQDMRRAEATVRVTFYVRS